MTEAVKDNPAEKVNNLSDEELEERFERDMENFKNAVDQYFLKNNSLFYPVPEL